MDIQALEARIKEIEAAREKFMNDANQQIGAFAGAIAEIQRLIELLSLPKEEEGKKP